MNNLKKIALFLSCMFLASCGEQSGPAPETDIATFPSKELEVIVPYSPGGGVDTTIRMLASVSEKYLNNNKIIVRNMPGGGGVIGQTAGANDFHRARMLLANFSAHAFDQTDVAPKYTRLHTDKGVGANHVFRHGYVNMGQRSGRIVQGLDAEVYARRDDAADIGAVLIDNIKSCRSAKINNN